MNPLRYRPLLLAAATAVAGLTLTSHASAAAIYYVDFGPNDGGEGIATPAPASNGLYYNNVINPVSTGGLMTPRPAATNLVSSTNAPSAIDVTATSGFTGSLGSFAGVGGLENPDANLRSDFRVGTATRDFFYTQGTNVGTIVFSDLNPTTTYNLELYGTRDNTEIRTTLYTATGGTGVPQTATLQTSGAGAGANGATGNNNTIVALNGLTPTAAGLLSLTVQTNNGTFGYIGSAALTDTSAVPEPASLGLLGLGGLSLIRRRRR